MGLGDFQQQVLDASADFMVLADFWADRCPPCSAIAPILQKFLNETREPVHLAKLEVDAGNNYETCRSLPSAWYSDDQIIHSR